MKKLTVVLALAGVLLLTGCDELQVPTHSEYIKLGQECYEAGGDWTVRGSGAYVCEFVH